VAGDSGDVNHNSNSSGISNTVAQGGARMATAKQVAVDRRNGNNHSSKQKPKLQSTGSNDNSNDSQ